MPFKITCQCDRVLVVPDKRAGSVIRCPKCERKIQVPEKLARQAPPPHLIDQALAEASEPIPPPIEKTAKPKIDAKSKPPPNPAPPPRSPKKDHKVVAAAQPTKSKPPRQETKSKPLEKPAEKKTTAKSPNKPDKTRPAKPVKPKKLEEKPTRARKDEPDSTDVVPLQRKPRQEKKAKPTPRSKPQGKEEKSPTRETQHVSPQPKPPAKPETLPATQNSTARTPGTHIVPASASSSPTEEATSTAGYRADRGRRQTVVYLAIWLLVITATSLVPAGLEIADRSKLDIWPGIPIWIHILILFAGIHVAYSIYLIQLPDWSTIWVVSIVTLIQAMIYAMLLGLSLLASIQSPILNSLELTHRLRGGSISLWCVVMICLNCLFAYFGGRFGLSWRSTRIRLLRSLEPPVG